MIYLDLQPVDWDKPIIWLRSKRPMAYFHAKLVSQKLKGSADTPYGIICTISDTQEEFYKVSVDGCSTDTRVIYNYIEFGENIKEEDVKDIAEFGEM